MLDIGDVAQVRRGKVPLHYHGELAVDFEGDPAQGEDTIGVDARK